jgi:hypothetical protein
MGDRAATRLPKPKTRGSAAFKAALDPLKKRTEFKDVGIGVIDFSRSHSSPDVWLFNEDRPYRIGSAGKIAILLAAVQLRCDVRKILALHPQIVSTPTELDALFGNRRLWRKAKAPKREAKAVLQIASNPPLVSKIFDFAKHPVDFAGPDPDGRKDAADKPVAAVQDAIFAKLASGHLEWETWSALSFSERFWLTGCLSDNVAATSCLSELGVPWVKAVQRSYGLADPSAGMNLFLSGGYSDITARRRAADAAPPRPLVGVDPITVEDYWWDPRTRKFSDRSSHVPGSAAALTAYMLALMTDGFVDDGSVALGGVGCTTIRKNLADGGPYDPDKLTEFPDHPGAIRHGVLSAANTTITRQIDKIGLLQPEIGAKAFLRCEFMYLETTTLDPGLPHGRKDLKYAIVATGVIADADKVHGTNAATKSVWLGAAVHQALLTL